MTPQTIITSARTIINDTDATLYRQSNTELLQFFNDGIGEISSLRPDIFTTVASFTCATGTVEQVMTFATAQTVVQVLSIVDGAALTPFDIPTMDAFNPNWRTDTTGDAKQWSKLPGDTLRFFIYPKAPGTAQYLSVRYVFNPTVLAISDSITELPAAFYPALVDYVVYRAEQKDDEHVDSGRVTAGYAAFVAKVKGA